MDQLDILIQEIEEWETYARKRAMEEGAPMIKAYFLDKADTYASLGSKLRNLRRIQVPKRM